MTALALRLRREDGVEGIGHCFEIITAAPWSAELSTFAWKMIEGVVPTGKATGGRWRQRSVVRCVTRPRMSDD
jgi:hypothetical protein